MARAISSEFVTQYADDVQHDTLRELDIQYSQPYRGEKIQHGLTAIDGGYNFAVHIGTNIESVDFCIQDETNPSITTDRWRLPDIHATSDGRRTAMGFIREDSPLSGRLYGLRTTNTDGEESPLIIDPYSRAVTRRKDPSDTRPETPYSVITPGPTAERIIKRPEIDPNARIIYETHVRDMTKNNPNIPEEIRGTYCGFAHPENIKYLKNLGITTVELLPVQQFTSEEHLVAGNRTNHWGYNTLGFFSPHDGYASDKKAGAVIDEFKNMVDELHEADIEVILDVVYNHTSEQGQNGPTYSLRALDDHGYYIANEHGVYADSTGCGNTLDLVNPAGRKLVMDSLHYWIEEMGVDGFRFDLAASMARNRAGNFSLQNSIFEDMTKDPVLKDRLLIAEPWDIWGYPQGHFAEIGIAEWSAAFRDTVRDSWKPGQKYLGKLAAVMTGSFDVHGAKPSTPVNFITAHDGFTLRDLTEYSSKHNYQNGENNRDGNNDNKSYNHGTEGPTDNPEIIHRRLRTARNMALTLLMSRGTPMLLGGDEKLHTQHGNNNAYCRKDDDQNPDIHSRKWDELNDADLSMLEFVKGAIMIRQTSSLGDPSIRMGTLEGSPIEERGVDWANRQGGRMSAQDWHTSPVVGMFTSGRAGKTNKDSYLTYVNIGQHPSTIHLPDVAGMAGEYVIVADTESSFSNPDSTVISPREISIDGLAMVVLRRISSRLPQTQIDDNLRQINIQFPSLLNNQLIKI